MKDGHYKIEFTTAGGTICEGSFLMREGQFVGADFLHSYQGDVRGTADDLQITMQCVRHAPEFNMLLGLPPKFDLLWRGRETDKGFEAEASLPGNKVLSASCTQLRA